MGNPVPPVFVCRECDQMDPLIGFPGHLDWISGWTAGARQNTAMLMMISFRSVGYALCSKGITGAPCGTRGGSCRAGVRCEGGGGTVRALLDRTLTRLIFEERRIQSTDRLLYLGMLFHRKRDIRGYAEAFGSSYEQARRSMNRLAEHDWVYSYKDAKSEKTFWVPWMPLDVEETVAREAEFLSDVADKWGEKLMKMILDTYVDDRHFIDNGRYKWLSSGGVNRMELDRKYVEAKVGGEFHGRQHFESVEFRSGKSNLVQQQIRDGLKMMVCQRRGVTLVEIAHTELSYETLEAAFGSLLSWIPPLKHRPLFKTFVTLCDRYNNETR